MEEQLKAALVDSLVKATSLEQELVEKSIEKPKNPEFGDIAFPCFALAKHWKTAPPQCAERVKDRLELPSGISEVTATGPFLNFRFDRTELIKALVETALSNEAPKQQKETVIVEYSSPNIAKPFHVGHLRTTLIGNCLYRVYRYLGYQTTSINHLGDWGTQFGFVWAGCELWGKPENPTVHELVELYKRATALRERQEKRALEKEEQALPDVNEMARSYFIELEKGEVSAKEFWQWCLDISLDYLKHTYDRFHIAFDHYIGESFYSDKLDPITEELRSSNLLQESEGALGVDLGEDEGFARVFTPDGRSLYLTRDLAAAKYRADRFGFDKALYVVGAPQTLHFRQLKGVLKALGHDYADKIIHVPFGHVLGMKTRGEGEVVELNDFLDEAYSRSLTAYREQVTKRPEGLDEEEVAKGVALAAIVFSNLGRNRIKNVHFKWEHALEFQGDSGPYLLYAYARINGIKEKALAAGLSIPDELDAEKLKEESAFLLARALGEFQDALHRTAQENEPSHLAAYALSLAKLFSKAYLELKVVGAEKALAEARLLLFEATRCVLGEALELLGMQRLERM